MFQNPGFWRIFICLFYVENAIGNEKGEEMEMNTKKYEELLVLLRSHKTDKEILEVLSDYHENDIADMLTGMNEGTRRLYRWRF